MPSKRKLPSLGLGRRVRARRDDDWEPEPESEEPESSDDVVSTGRDAGDDDDDDSPSSAPASESPSESHASEDDDGDDDAGDDAPPKVDLSSISFGALARAQASLPPLGRRAKRPRPDGTPDAADVAPRPPARAGKPRDKQPAPKRASKHAPQEQSSKRPVPRGRRDIVAAAAAARSRTPRDPRFDPLVAGSAPDDARARNAYAFLDDYRDAEMAALRAQLARARDPAARDALARQLASMEDRKRARARRDDELRLLRDHRRREKDLVARGKRPFYLKKSEQKRQLLTRRFEGMTKGQVDRAVERKRKKVAGKEKKELDSLQRVRNRH